MSIQDSIIELRDDEMDEVLARVRGACDWLQAPELAKRLNLSESKIYQLVEGGKLEHHRFGGAIRFSEEQITGYLEETRQERREEGKSILPRPHLKHVRL